MVSLNSVPTRRRKCYARGSPTSLYHVINTGFKRVKGCSVTAAGCTCGTTPFRVGVIRLL